VIRLARRSPLATAGALIVGLVIVAALAAPLLATTDPIDQDLSEALKPPFWLADGSMRHPLGTDHLGRDVYSRLIYGAQNSSGSVIFRCPLNEFPSRASTSASSSVWRDTIR
jgi:ABC-type dipeptide/oligopeptide/nickel transport system permease subunit